MKLVVFIPVALLFVKLVSSGHVEDESAVSCKSTLKLCINTDCLGNNTVLEEIKQELCDIQDSECTDNPCKNGGTCINVKDTPVCQCPPEFVGKVCELNCTVEYETLPKVLLDRESFRQNEVFPSEEECDSACIGDCTTSVFVYPRCFLCRAPVLSVTSIPIESGVEACKSICTSQTTSCRSYLGEVLDFDGEMLCFTFTVSATGLPVSPTGSSTDIFNKIKKCDISP